MLTNANNTRAGRSTITALFCSVFRVATRLIPFPIPRTRLGRRRLTVAFAAVVVSVPILTWFTGSVVPLLVLAPILALLVLALGLSVDLITDRPTRSLDERERRVRDSALARPLELGIVLGVAIGFLARWSMGNDDPLPVAALMATSLLAFCARLIAIAWALPDSIGEE